jgi:hypothetical protein
MHGEGVPDIPPPRPCISLLRRRGPDADQQAPLDRQAVTPADHPGEHLGLIEPASPATEPVERHRHHPVPVAERQQRGRFLGQEASQMAQHPKMAAMLAE